MLDLDGERLIIDIFQHFLSALRKTEVGNIFTFMSMIISYIGRKWQSLFEIAQPHIG